MSLLELQRSLVGFARGSTDAYQQCRDLTPLEREWLTQVLNSGGLRISQQIQQWWRISRICSTAYLTIELLKRNEQAELILDYITHEPIRTLFFAAELEQFKSFLHQHPQVDATTKSVIAFEAGIKAAIQLAATKTYSRTEQFPLLITFWCNPGTLLTALLTGDSLPALEEEPYQVEINPELESLWICHRRKEISHQQPSH